MRGSLPLLALTVGAFGIGVTEFAPMGMLPGIATDLGVTIPAAGLLVSAYALGVVIGAPLMILSTTKVKRRALLVMLMAVFTLGSLLSAVAGSYAILMIGRIITSFAHAAFFGAGAVVATSVVPPDKRADAVSKMFMGLTVATIGGSPLAAWLGETLGWRTSFWAIAGIGLIAMLLLRLALPDLPASKDRIMDEVRVLGRGPVLIALALTVLGSSTMFTVFTYIAPILRDVAHASTGFVTAMLVIFGVGMTLGNIISGRAADRNLDRTLIASFAVQALVLLLFSFAMRWEVLTAFLIPIWGMATFAAVPPLQIRVMHAAADAPALASAMNIGAFNLGNAVGAALGGAVISTGFSYTTVSLAGAVVAASALALALLLRSRSGRAPREPKLARTDRARDFAGD